MIELIYTWILLLFEETSYILKVEKWTKYFEFLHKINRKKYWLIYVSSKVYAICDWTRLHVDMVL